MAEQLSPKNQTESAVADLKEYHSHGYLFGLSARNIEIVADPQPVGILGPDQYDAIMDLEKLRETFMELPEEVIIKLAERASAELADDMIDHSGKDPKEIRRVWTERRFNHRFILNFLSEEQKAKL